MCVVTSPGNKKVDKSSYEERTKQYVFLINRNNNKITMKKYKLRTYTKVSLYKYIHKCTKAYVIQVVYFILWKTSKGTKQERVNEDH